MRGEVYFKGSHAECFDDVQTGECGPKGEPVLL